MLVPPRLPYGILSTSALVPLLPPAPPAQVMSTLKSLASQGHTVVCSIHQPRSSIFAMFDDLLLLSEGRPVYWGPADQVRALGGHSGVSAVRNGGWSADPRTKMQVGDHASRKG